MADENPLQNPAPTPSGIPLGDAAMQQTQEMVQAAVGDMLAEVLTNPSNPIGEMVRMQAQDALQSAHAGTQTMVQGWVQPVDGRSAMYYYGWAGGCAVGAGLNYYAMWALPPEHRWLRVLSFIQGTALVAAAAINVQKAGNVRRR